MFGGGVILPLVGQLKMCKWGERVGGRKCGKGP